VQKRTLNPNKQIGRESCGFIAIEVCSTFSIILCQNWEAGNTLFSSDIGAKSRNCDSFVPEADVRISPSTNINVVLHSFQWLCKAKFRYFMTYQQSIALWIHHVYSCHELHLAPCVHQTAFVRGLLRCIYDHCYDCKACKPIVYVSKRMNYEQICNRLKLSVYVSIKHLLVAPRYYGEWTVLEW
jgi:hypothetical protein